MFYSKAIRTKHLQTIPNNSLQKDTELIYSQTCIKRSPLGQRKSGLIRQVTSWKRFISHEILYDRTNKRWPLNTGDCMVRFDCIIYNLTPFRSLFSSKAIRTNAVRPGPLADPPYNNKNKNHYHTSHQTVVGFPAFNTISTFSHCKFVNPSWVWIPLTWGVLDTIWWDQPPTPLSMSLAGPHSHFFRHNLIW